MSNKFKFTIEYQFDLLRYIVLDKNGVKALDKVDDTYFTLTEHSIIAFALKQYYKKNKQEILNKAKRKYKEKKLREHYAIRDKNNTESKAI